MAAQKSQKSQLFHAEFRDSGDFGRQTGGDFDFRQIDSGPQTVSASVLSGERIIVSKLGANRGFHQCGTPPHWALTFGLPELGMQDWFGRPYQEHSILPFNQVSGIDGVSKPPFEAYLISFGVDFVQEISTTYQLPVADDLFAPATGSFIPDSRQVRNMRSAVRGFFDNPQARFGKDQEVALTIELLRAAMLEADIEDKSSPTARARAVSRALEFIEQHRRDVITVGQICAATGIGWRTLDRAFLQRFGFGPKAYLKRVRLSGVRTELAVRGPDTLIADAANDWGFWHMGQFARDYRQLYGELPSAMLDRSRR